MGVPKFFRWISERYPTISQLIAENRIPEFDALYLDMNGIIHNCTHKDSDSPDFRMTEDQMFIAIFNYIEHLFGKIKPQKLFFMAIDGVAPRAKMNQQRARRFRTALDAEKAREAAIKQGLEMPKEPPFDSNCITPGTEFMARLTQQLKYFISKKVTEDTEWQGVEVVLSGHEVPGEGEHKIMEYIRQAKSQPGYDPNVRHCLYGLDADLIMLGLLSHDPHFCLLREEVTFGRQSQKKSKELEHQNFYLMHLCVVREYLELEFQDMKEPGALTFSFDMERIIDDFILMAFFVGNDFLPNIPHLHINEGALALMFDTYKKVLPKAQGYINEGGIINLHRLSLLLDELSQVEYRFFEAENADASWLKNKQKADTEEVQKSNKRGQLVVSPAQKDIFKGIKQWVNSNSASSDKQPYNLTASLPARDREFVKQLAESLHVQWNTVEDANGDRHMQLSFFPTPEDDEDDDVDDEEAQAALFRVVKRYDNAKVVEVSPEDAQAEMERKYQEKFRAWRDDYYKKKFEWGLDDEEEMRKLTENYVQGLQWVLLYYYRGVASWPWFFRYHYSPMIADVKKGLNVDMNFQLGQPFHPYEQLMGVLPDRSKSIVPTAFHELMTSPESPIIDFYPRDFELDMNGKKMDWEAVIKIPFIEEDRLLSAMKTKEHLLTEEEKARNQFGVSLKFVYSANVNYTYPSSLPGIFNDIPNCRCIMNIFELPTMDGLDVYVGLTNGVKLGIESLAGFPTLKTLPFDGQLAHHGVSVFQQESRNQSMIVTLRDAEVAANVEAAKLKLGQVVHVGFPYLQEAKVVKVSDEMFDYCLAPEGQPQVMQVPHEGYQITDFRKKAERIESVYSKRLGIIVGTVESLVHVAMLRGLIKTDKGDFVKEYGDIPGMETEYAAQTIVDSVVSEDQRFLEKAALPIDQEFPLGSRAFFLGEMAFGRPLEVYGYAGGDKVDIWVNVTKGRDEQWGRRLALEADRTTQYTPAFAVARMLHMNALALSKITSSFNVIHKGLRLNLGLNLKFESKKLKVLGYSRKGESGWEYSQKAIDLITEYMIKFPNFIAHIQNNPKGDEYKATDFYPDLATADEKMKEIGAWLKSFNSKGFEKVPLDAEQLDSDACKLIEQAADQVMNSSPPVDIKRVKAVPRHALLKPADAQQRLGAQRFYVGDRVIYVQDSGKVPLGMSATVVGLTQTARGMFLDILCDSTFMSGTSLGERCSAFRGASVPSPSVLNLTDRQVIADTRAASARQQPQSRPIYANGAAGYGAGGYGTPIGPNGQGQLFSAAAPPPLKGSFANATRGRARGGGLGYNAGPPQQQQQNVPFHTRGRGRGRGGAANGRGGYTIVDNTDPTEGILKHNPNFRPQNMSRVPPPTNLSSTSRGRGGRGRGNANGQTRGRGGRGAAQTVPQT